MREAVIVSSVRTAVGKAGRLYTILNTTGTNAVTVGTTSAQTINGGATDSLAAQWSVGRYISDGDYRVSSEVTRSRSSR